MTVSVIFGKPRIAVKSDGWDVVITWEDEAQLRHFTPGDCFMFGNHPAHGRYIVLEHGDGLSTVQHHSGRLYEVNSTVEVYPITEAAFLAEETAHAARERGL